MKDKFIPSPYFPSLKDKRYVRFKLFKYAFSGDIKRRQTLKLLHWLTKDKIIINHKVY